MSADAVSRTSPYSRISGLTFKPVKNAAFAKGHNDRDERYPEPSYLLPKHKRLPNKTVLNFGTDHELKALFSERKSKLSRQARRANVSPFWQGVCVLPEVDKFETVEEYLRIMSERLLVFRDEFEKLTGCKVLDIAIHLDEGFWDEETGELALNPHAHIIVDRSVAREFDKKRKRDFNPLVKRRAKQEDCIVLWKPTPSQLAEVQTLCAKALEMNRGSTYEERGSKPSRKHVDHAQWRAQQMELRQQAAFLGIEADYALEVQNNLAEYNAEKAAKVAQAAIKKARDSADARIAFAEAKGFLRGFITGKGAKPSDFKAIGQMFEQEDDTLLCLQKEIQDGRLVFEEVLGVLRGASLEAVLKASELLSECDKPEGWVQGFDGSEAPLLEPEMLCLGRFIRKQPRGRDLYVIEDASPGQRLAFEDKGNRIDIRRSNDDEVLRQAVFLASQKWPQGVCFSGSDEFVQWASGIANEMGIDVYQSRNNDDRSP